MPYGIEYLARELFHGGRCNLKLSVGLHDYAYALPMNQSYSPYDADRK